MKSNSTNKRQKTDVLPFAIAQKIRTIITQRGLKPGDRLPTERELVEEFGVSRSTLREAMKVLRAENIVEIRQGSGTFISKGTGIGDDPLGLRFTNQKSLLKNLFEARILIEPYIAGLAAQRATPQDVEKLERMAKELENIKENSSMTAEMDVQFHTAVAECTHNEVLIRVIPVINESIRRSYAENYDEPERFKKSKKHHVDICRAIANGEHQTARFLAERHIWETFEDVDFNEGNH